MYDIDHILLIYLQFESKYIHEFIYNFFIVISTLLINLRWAGIEMGSESKCRIMLCYEKC